MDAALRQLRHESPDHRYTDGIHALVAKLVEQPLPKAASAIELYSTHDWNRLSQTETETETETETRPFIAGVAFTPGERESIVSDCALGNNDEVALYCRHDLYTAGGRFVQTLPLTADWPDFAADAELILSGSNMLRRSSGKVTVLDPAITAAAFAPNGDVIAGSSDGTLLRLCGRGKGSPP